MFITKAEFENKMKEKRKMAVEEIIQKKQEKIKKSEMMKEPELKRKIAQIQKVLSEKYEDEGSVSYGGVVVTVHFSPDICWSSTRMEILYELVRLLQEDGWTVDIYPGHGEDYPDELGIH